MDSDYVMTTDEESDKEAIKIICAVVMAKISTKR